MRCLVWVLGCGVMMAAAGCLNPYEDRTAPRLPHAGLEDRFSRFVFTLTKRQREEAAKQRRLLALMRGRGMEAAVVSLPSNIAWLTAGRWERVTGQTARACQLVITPEDKYVICPNSDADRLMAGPLNGLDYEALPYPWQSDGRGALRELLAGMRVGADQPEGGQLAVDFRELHFPLTPDEMDKCRWLGDKASRTVEYIARSIKRDMSDVDVQYLVAKEFAYWDIAVPINRVVVEDRVGRHPTGAAVGQKLLHHCMIRICVERWGLCMALARQVYLGDPPKPLLSGFEKSAAVLGAVYNASRAGQTLGQIAEAGARAYTKQDAAAAWAKQPLGGTIGYRACLTWATPGVQVRVVPGMALAWCAAVDGALCEDTIVTTADGTVEVLTACQDWPVHEVKISGTTHRIPGLLVRH